jgi:hypothetical protein
MMARHFRSITPLTAWTFGRLRVHGASLCPCVSRAVRLAPVRGGGFGWVLLRCLARRVDVHLRPPCGKTVCATMRIAGPAAPAAT